MGAAKGILTPEAVKVRLWIFGWETVVTGYGSPYPVPIESLTYDKAILTALEIAVGAHYGREIAWEAAW